jgi:hypothetical protein
MIILSATNPDKAALVKLLKAAKQAYYNTGEFYKAEPAYSSSTHVSIKAESRLHSLLSAVGGSMH